MLIIFFHRYIFFADKVEIQDITKQTSMFALLGTKCSKVQFCSFFMFFWRHLVYIRSLLSISALLFLMICDLGQIMEDLNLGDLVGQPYGSHKHYSVSRGLGY